ncbi:MAG: ABC transporter ATP-binding protein [Ignavibacteria bacterium]|nr:ABC transporter ATP-binding protein [Ignavibacteria bacterium]MBK7158694.1 ABC transporter ATP-binding protein [Ignavibacteria bacterium]MBK7254920.1 ABC transporter ATP-binding protein [Ignavibacteria bacterium]MBK8380818.1 ABC transporter ATP-binding protein [Ignavibacteria bacterium]MBK9405819.1 ABC transporter ATP-binding protein [Ignavibacteria bacterium]
MQKKLVEIKNLRTYFFVEATDQQISDENISHDSDLNKLYASDKYLKGKVPAKAVDNVSFDIYEGEVLGIVGESGSGKSVTAYSITRLIPDPPGKIVAGEVIYKGKDLLKITFDEMKNYRGKEIAMIFQEPMTSLNPVMKIGDQISEILLQHENVNKEEAFKQGVNMLELVGIPSPEKRMKDYPHQFSGGMRQRVMIAMALACNPSLLIADEPTTALDVTIQAQILDLMLKLKNERKESAILLITHNLGVVAETCNRVIVMYGGKIQEIADAEALFGNPLHPYTKGLLESLPDPDKPKDTLQAIPGIIPHILELPKGCKFSTRCTKVFDKCITDEPELLEIESKHFVRCHLYNL